MPGHISNPNVVDDPTRTQTPDGNDATVDDPPRTELTTGMVTPPPGPRSDDPPGAPSRPTRCAKRQHGHADLHSALELVDWSNKMTFETFALRALHAPKAQRPTGPGWAKPG